MENFILRYAQYRNLTPPLARAEVLATLEQVAHNLAPSYTFGIFRVDDLEQEVWALALEVLASGRVDPTRPLENFLYVHISNRLKNLKRKYYFRSEPPCRCCDPFGEPLNPCSRWLNWRRSNTAKQSLAAPTSPDSFNPPVPDGLSEAVEDRELEATILRGLSPRFRADYLRLRAGARVPQARLAPLREAVAALLGLELEEELS